MATDGAGAYPLTVDTPQDSWNRPLTHRDLDDTPEDGNRYEVIDGELYVSPFPTTAHQRAQTRLLVALSNHVSAHALGEVFTAGLKVVLDTPTGVGPDIVFITRAHLDQVQRDGFYGSPELLVEVVSSKPGLDRIVKFRKYAEAAVPHYWIVDPERRTVQAFALDESKKYRLDVELKDNDLFKPTLFPGLTIDLRDLWW